MSETQHGVASLKSLATVAKVLIWLFVVVLAITTFPMIATLLRQLQLADPPLELLGLGGLAGLLQILMFGIAMVAICLWTWRAHANLSAGGMAGLSHSPGWAVLSFFVPVANLIVPMQAMRALHNRSHGGLPEWSSSSVGPVTSWWTCHIAAVLLLSFLSGTVLLPLLTNAFTTTPPAADTGLAILAQILGAGSAWFLLRIIREVTEAQAGGAFAASVFE
jgi:Domain of unknown function (DUF4328)